MSWHGHYWTIAPWISHQIRRCDIADGETVWFHAEDPAVGPIRLRGRLRHPSGARTLLVILHGLGGDSDSHYMLPPVRAAEDAGMASLRFEMRGADPEGTDFYHAGLTSDLAAALASARLDRYTAIHLIGYSIGGHVCLRYASESPDPRLRSVAAVCPPLELDPTASALDAPKAWVYRQHILRGLKALLTRIAAHRAPPIPLDEARRIQALRAWDDRVVAPRYGFKSAEHYYAEVSAGPRLHALRVPTLLLEARGDPMIPPGTVQRSLEAARDNRSLDARMLDVGGHVGFPRDLNLGVGGNRGLDPQVTRWLLSRAG